ncbi:type II toxin-antitoxin system Phd/YefM family antitoxin [Clostridium sp.]|uniref:type II toxin-antitoxin system Phd/YefM family antitoxin n=1 Tax=Clostridium sp. TaxID=1506 RepID=UPI00260D5232|nr:type II toxin-antitoxin system Phd/YefM family antitoxin [Clostridium sp.]
MINDISINNVLNSLVPISRFNKGEANKIFDEVKETGCKIVLKNNVPTCILITPEKYNEMMETIENYNLLVEAEMRIKNSKDEELISQSDMLSKLNINPSELDNIEVEIE